MTRFAGLDVHSKWSAFVIRNEHGTEVTRGKFDTTTEGIAAFVKEQGFGEGDVIGLESGGVSFFVARQLTAACQAKVVVIDAREVRDKARSKKKKSDFRDAEDISDGLVRRAYVRIVRIPDAWEQQTRDALSKREHFTAVMRAEVCSAKSTVRRQGKRHVYKSLVTIKAWERLMAHEELDEATKADLKRHFEVWQLAREHVGAFDNQLEELAKQRQAQVDRLQTVPGIGPVISVTVLAYMGDAARFDSAKHAASYAGLVPSTYDSADAHRHGRITAEGSPALRRALVLAAQHAGRKGNPLNRSFTRVMVKKSRGTAIVASANRLARICYSMLKHERDFDPSRFDNPKWHELTQRHQAQAQRAAG